jgi:serine/threonine protein kinase
MKPGDHIGPHHILAPIGTGGMGEVWKARDTRREFDAAVEHALNALDERFPSFFFMVLRPHERALRQSPAWPALLKKLTLSESRP